MKKGQLVKKSSVAAGLGLLLGSACLVGAAWAEPTALAPGERSTPETIRFESVTEEQLEKTAITGAFDPPGVVLDLGPVEPVYLSATFLRARGMDPEEEKQRRDFLSDSSLFGDRRTGAEAPIPVIQRPGFENRTYSPSSSVSTTHRPAQ